MSKDRRVPEHNEVILGTGCDHVQQIISLIKEVPLVQITAAVDRRKQDDSPLRSLEGMDRTDLHPADRNICRS